MTYRGRTLQRQVRLYNGVYGIGYDMLNPATVWNVVETKLHILHEQVSDLLKS